MRAPADLVPDRWPTGDNFGLRIPADPEALLDGGRDFLTTAFRAAGALGADNRVVAVVESSECFDGGSGKKLFLTVAYEHQDPGLPTRLFVKFSRHFENQLWDSARHMMISEVDFALLSRTPDFPVRVPRCLFADVEAASATGLLVTERIPYGEGGVEPFHVKYMDYLLDDPVEHYRAILGGLGRLSGAHRAGKLPAAFDERFPYDHEQETATLGVHPPQEVLVQRANRMFDFLQRYPHLFPEHLSDPALRGEFIGYIGDVLAASSRIRDILLRRYREHVAFGHWNANIDNCWFERDAQGRLQCGFIDWANCAQMHVARTIGGALNGAESWVWAAHLDELLGVFIDEFADQGAPRPDPEELRRHILLSSASSFGLSMAAPVAIAREIADIDALSGPRDEVFRDLYTPRVMLHLMTSMLENWQALSFGDMVRRLR